MSRTYPALVLLASLVAAAPAPAEVKVEKVEYKGWKNNVRLSNGTVEVIATLDVGPRIICYRFLDGKNVLHEVADQLGKSGEEGWIPRGGHRLWTAPEDLTRTYSPDNGPITYKLIGKDGVRLIQPIEKDYGIQKEIEIRLAPNGSRVMIRHRITNVGKEPTRLSPWGLTVMAPGGTEVIPLPAKKPHPGPPKKAKSPKDYAPNLKIMFWSYFDFTDPRWTFGKKYIWLKQTKRGPTKIGLAHKLGWVGYLNAGTLFVKRVEYRPDQVYPDGGCNFETFTNEAMLEIETLGPLKRLRPGDSVESTEHWQLNANVPPCPDAASVDKHILPLLK